MSNSAEVLKEYVAILGWQVDKESWRKFQASMSKSVEVIGEIAVATAAVAEVIDRAVDVIAARFEKMYYAAALAGSSVEHLNAVEAGAQKIGMAAGEATAQIQALASQLRSSPGSKGILAALGVNPEQEGTKVYIDLIEKLKALSDQGTFGHALATNYAGMFGMTEEQLFLAERGLKAFKEGIALNEKMVHDSGARPDEQALAYVKYQNTLRDLQTSIDLLEKAIGVRLLPVLDEFKRKLTALVDWISHTNVTTGGLNAIGLAIAAIVAAVLKSLPSITGFVLRQLGLGGLAELGAGGAAATVAGGGATAAGGGLIATLAPLVAGVLVALGLGYLLDKAGVFEMGGDKSVHKTFNRWFNATADWINGKADAANAAAEDGLTKGNNPGNMRAWAKGQAIFSKGSSGSFVSFNSALEGISAMAGQLMRYGNGGIDTVSGIISKWAPRKDHNDTDSYIAQVAKSLSVKAGDHLNLGDSGTLQKLIHAIIVREGGKDPYSTTLIGSAVSQRLRTDGGGMRSLRSEAVINVHGVNDSGRVGKIIADAQTRILQDAMRNLAPKVN